MRNISSLVLLLLLLLSNCNTNNESNSSDNKKQTSLENLNKLHYSFTTHQIDSLYKNNKLTKIIYPNMSTCGGALEGYYFQDNLLYINSKYGAEIGFSSKKIYWNKDEIRKIIYKEHFVEWDEYAEKNHQGKTEYDSSKITYSDTIYEINFEATTKFKKIVNNEIISTKSDSTIIERLVNCGIQMKVELESIIE
ncbi:MAG: hypothetical protein ACPG4Z_02920 [Chitinophagales bacterium]